MNLRATYEPTEAEIQTQAYLLYLASGYAPARDLENWLAAKELLRHRARPPKGNAKNRSTQRLHFPPSEASQHPWHALPSK